MRKINIIAAAMALVLFASCDRKLDFPHETFATFDAVSFTVEETVGQVKVPVSIYNPTGSEVQVTVKAVDGLAVSGADYEIVSPASGILTFSGDVTTQDVVVNITDCSGEFTGAKDFAIEIASATSGVSVGNLNQARFTIIDLDHPLSGFVGEWAGTLMFASNPPSPLGTVLKIAVDDTDDTFTKLLIEGLEANYASYAAGYAVTAIYNAETSSLVIPAGQVGMYVSSAYDFRFVGLDDAWENIIDFELKYDAEAQTLTLMNVYAMMDIVSGGLYSAYNSGTVFTKK